MWPELASQMLGAGMAAQAQGVQFGDSLSPYSSGYNIPLFATTTTSTSNTLYIDNADMDEAKMRVEEPPDEFTQLSNHKFHELLDRFYKLT